MKASVRWAYAWAAVIMGLGAWIPSARAMPSEFGRIVSIDESPNTLLSCVVGNRSGNGTAASPHRVMTRLRRYNSQGISQDDWKITHPYVWQRARLRCFSSSAMTDGEHAFGELSTDEGGEFSTATCPAHKPYGEYGECQLNVLFASESSYVYRGTACGDGITGIWVGDLARLTGSPASLFYDENFQNVPKAWNDTSALAGVGLTDLGIPFFSAGRMYYAFGDTREWLGATDRHNVLARRPVGAFDPFAVRFEDFERPGNVAIAPQLIPNREGDGPIPSAGFAISELGADGIVHEHRYMHFAGITGWGFAPLPGSSNERACIDTTDTDPNTPKSPFCSVVGMARSSIARSTDGGPWVRLDAAQPTGTCSNTGGLWWCPSSNFTGVAAWHDTTTGYVYMLGYSVDRNAGFSDSPLKAMRVRATKAAIESKAQYEYWIGNAAPPAGCTTAPWCKGTESLAATLKDTSGRNLAHVRDVSVSYNSYANRFVLMYVSAGYPDSWLAMYQAPAITGPWSPVATGLGAANPLPAIPSQYGPFLHDRNTALQGQIIVHSLSENYLAWGAEPYNVAIRPIVITRKAKPGCQ